MTAKPSEISDDLEIAKELAEAARSSALRYFRTTSLQLNNKRSEEEGAFDPVTVADQEIESVLRDILADKRPEDGVLGEEHENTVGTSGRTWVLDPIDGTRAYMCGLPTWGVLIALNDGQRPILGVMDQPFTDERYVGVTDDALWTAFLRHDGHETRLATRRCARLADAVMCSTAPDAFPSEDDAAVFAGISAQTKLTRFGTDCYGYAMIARGQIDLVVEAGLQAYDIQAMIPIVEAAGGVVSNWSGGDCQEGGQVVAAGDPALHAQAVRALSG